MIVEEPLPVPHTRITHWFWVVYDSLLVPKTTLAQWRECLLASGKLLKPFNVLVILFCVAYILFGAVFVANADVKECPQYLEAVG